MKRPMTTAELFNEICSILKEKSKLPDILDYGLATQNPISLKNCEFNLKSNLDYGRSEGIYLDLWIEYFEDDGRSLRDLGTFKTLEDDDNAMHTMAHLLADFILETCNYIGKNRDDFNWTGVGVHMMDENGKMVNLGYCCGSMEEASTRKDELMDKYPEVIIRDNATRMETHFIRQVVKVADERREGTEDVQAG